MPNAMLRVQLHRWGRFTVQGGQAYTYAFCCWALTPQLPVAGQWSGGEAPDCYALPMDDHGADWLRLCAEAWASGHPDKAIAKAAAPHALVHTGGVQHPQWSHIRLGGQLRWQQAPQPAVAGRLDMLSALDFDGLVEHLCGPNPFKGVLLAGQ